MEIAIYAIVGVVIGFVGYFILDDDVVKVAIRDFF